MMELVEFTEYIVKNISKDADLVKVHSMNGENDSVILTVLVPENSMGAVIGYQGKNAKSIRTLIQAYAYLHKLGRVEVNIESF